jgi:hypothetical protein
LARTSKEVPRKPPRCQEWPPYLTALRETLNLEKYLRGKEPRATLRTSCGEKEIPPAAHWMNKAHIEIGSIGPLVAIGLCDVMRRYT